MNLQGKLSTILHPRTCLNTILVAGLCIGMSTLGVAQTGGTGTGTTGTSTTGSGATGTGAADLNTLQGTISVSGMEENGVLKFEFIRTDLNPTIKGQGTTRGFLAHGFLNFWNVSNATSGTTGTTGTGTTGTTGTAGTAGAASTAASLMTAELVFQESEVPLFTKAMVGANASAA